MVGVPQLAVVRYVVLGGKYVTTVAGAVPNELKGLLVAVPPVITSVLPTLAPPGSTQVVVKVMTVGAELLLTEAAILMY